MKILLQDAHTPNHQTYTASIVGHRFEGVVANGINPGFARLIVELKALRDSVASLPLDNDSSANRKTIIELRQRAEAVVYPEFPGVHGPRELSA